MTTPRLLVFAVAFVSASVAFAGGDAAAYTGPKRINKAIELLESGQPVYYGYGRGGYVEGKEAADTWADILMYDMEGAALDFTMLREFMRGLVDGGPTKSGHRTPAVIVTLPLYGLDEQTVTANHWMIQQALAAGIHGLHICHARDPGAVRAFVRAARYEIHRQSVGDGLEEGLRAFGAHAFASEIWGVSAKAYYGVADVWPLNPRGEIMIGVKIEDGPGRHNTESIVRVPGLSFAEWGPRDTSYAAGHLDVAFDYGRCPRRATACRRRFQGAACRHARRDRRLVSTGRRARSSPRSGRRQARSVQKRRRRPPVLQARRTRHRAPSTPSSRR
jgi:4-hydroxy-2-oxoheptanedioate aldolase